MIKLKELQDNVEKRISEYIEFDVIEIFDQSDYITIYGGAVRDSLANLDIHDIDILCMPDSAKKLRSFLNTKGYTTLDLYDVDSLNMYKGISLISEPWTLMNEHRKIIQIIRPVFDGPNTSEMEYQLAYYNLIKNVDISCCGVFLENFGYNIKLRESCENAIIQCLYRNRTDFREYKLTSRGWKPYTGLIKMERKMKLVNLEFTPEYNYKIWTEEEYLNRPKTRKDLYSDLPF